MSSDGSHIPGVSRRQVIVAAAGMGAALVLPATARASDEHTRQFAEAYDKLRAGAEPAPTLVRLDMPEIAENGNMVPFTVAVESPMTPDSHVKTVTILSTGNPQPVIATFELSPRSGRATVSGRLRLARTQDIFAVAMMNSGALHQAVVNVKVTVGGCGG